jgi:Ca-activated chloride channel homolog
MRKEMRNQILLIVLCIPLVSIAQVENPEIRKGNKEYDKNAFNEAELNYRKALEKNPASEKATYNLGDALYKQNQFEPSITKYESLINTRKSPSELSKYYYNLGNAYYKTQKLDKAIEAYKQCLRLSPRDADAKHNLFLAENTQNQQQQQKNKDQKNQDKKDDQQQKQDQQKSQDQKDKQDQQQKQDQQNNQEQQQKQDQQQAGKEQQMSKEDAERLLEALQQDEKNVIKKVEDQKMKARKVPVEKEW